MKFYLLWFWIDEYEVRERKYDTFEMVRWACWNICRGAHDAGAATAIVNVGETRADAFVGLKIQARLGEVCLCLFSTVHCVASHPLCCRISD